MIISKRPACCFSKGSVLAFRISAVLPVACGLIFHRRVIHMNCCLLSCMKSSPSSLACSVVFFSRLSFFSKRNMPKLFFAYMYMHSMIFCATSEVCQCLLSCGRYKNINFYKSIDVSISGNPVIPLFAMRCTLAWNGCCASLNNRATAVISLCNNVRYQKEIAIRAVESRWFQISTCYLNLSIFVFGRLSMFAS